MPLENAKIIPLIILYVQQIQSIIHNIYANAIAFLSLKTHNSTNSEKSIPKNLQIVQLVNLMAFVIPFSPVMYSVKLKNTYGPNKNNIGV